MGVLHGRDLYSPNWINAEIDDASGRRWVVPIKTTIGDYFLTEIENQLYCFEIDHSAVKTYRGTGLRSIRFLNYDTKHFRPITQKVKQLELTLRKNSLPRMNGMMAGVFKILGRREKANFENHKITDLIDELKKHADEYAEQVRNIVTYLRDLDIEEIVTPVRGVSDYIEDDLKTTRPAFLGSIISHFQRLDGEHKKVTNTPLGPKRAWMKMLLLIMGVMLVGFILYWGYTEGWFDFITTGIGSIQFPSFTPPPMQGGGSQDIMKRYSSPEELRAAIDRGEIKESQLPPDVRELVKGVKTPTATPVP